MQTHKSLVRFLFIGSVGAMVPAVPAAADAVADFYSEKQIILLTGTRPGGSYGLYGGILGKYMRDHIPGKPKIVMNYMPGAGGGKAANYGLLRDAIPAESPVAGAYSFDLWNGFMDQAVTGGNTLRQEIAARLSAYQTWPPPDVRALTEELDGIRDMIKNTAETTFTPALRNAVMRMLGDPQYGFDPNSKIKFRSSTNVEDSDTFIGAGLYSSYSGCIADELDSDSDGPSICDPDQPSERGVFSLISDRTAIEMLSFWG